jgi:pilus assembly protein FimV
MSTESGPAVIDTSSLDFDLGFGDDNSPAVPELPVSQPVAQTVTEAQEPDLGVIDFDFGEPQAPAVQQEQSVPSEQEVSLADDNSLDFSLPDLDLSAPLQDSVPELTIEASPEVSDPAQAIELSLSGESSGEDVPVLDFALEEPAQEQEPHLPADVQASAFDFDLSGIDLNLEPQVASDAESVVSADAEPENAEMSTKLDLAVAYQEIGDKEGARELLDEVVRGGTASA